MEDGRLGGSSTAIDADGGDVVSSGCDVLDFGVSTLIATGDDGWVGL